MHNFFLIYAYNSYVKYYKMCRKGKKMTMKCCYDINYEFLKPAAISTFILLQSPGNYE